MSALSCLRWQTMGARCPCGMVWSTGGHYLAVGTADGEIDIYVAADGTQMRSLTIHRGPILTIAWRPGSPIIATSGEDGAVRITDVQSCEVHDFLPPGNTPALHLAWNSGGTKLAVAAGSLVYVFRADGELISRLPVTESAIALMAWSPTEEHIAYAGVGFLGILNPAVEAPGFEPSWDVVSAKRGVV